MSETRRIWRIIAALGIAGTLVASFRFGAPVAIGFGTGAAFSAANFWFWHRLVRRIGETGPEPDAQPRSASAVFFGARYFIFVLAGYAILNYFEASILAALIGCFIAVVAVILEILLELFYGT